MPKTPKTLRHISDLPSECIHNNSTHRIQLISTDEQKKGNIATMNYAWLEPGKELELHTHPDGEEYYVFLDGIGSMRVGNDTFPVSAQDFITVPENAGHSLKNTGAVNLVFITVRTVRSG